MIYTEDGRKALGAFLGSTCRKPAYTEPLGPPPSHRYHHLRGAGPTDCTQIVRVNDSQSPLVSAVLEGVTRSDLRPGGLQEARTWVSSTNLASPLQPSVVEAA